MNRFSQAAADTIRTRSKKYKIDRIVIHAMDGTLAGTEAWFKTAGRAVPTAAHYLVGRNGDVVQMVPDDRKALHAGSPVEAGWNDRSLGIECEVRVLPWTGKARFPLNDWPEALMLSLTKVVRALCTTYAIPRDRVHIVGHSEVPGATHIDPGPGFDFDDLMRRLNPVAPDPAA